MGKGRKAKVNRLRGFLSGEPGPAWSVIFALILAYEFWMILRGVR